MIKKISKFFVATMLIFTLFSTTIVQSTASAASTNNISVDIDTTEKIDLTPTQIEKNKDESISTYGLPPRDPSKDPFWIAITGVLLVFVAAEVANTFINNAVNNGIDAACKKFKDTPGIKQACAIFN